MTVIPLTPSRMGLSPNHIQPGISSPSPLGPQVANKDAILPPLITPLPENAPALLPSHLCFPPPPPPHRSELTLAQRNDWSAARILNQSMLPACLAGPPVSAFYGSDDLWVWVPILVQDALVDAACKVLIENGYNEELSMDDNEVIAQFQPPDRNENETKALRWRLFSFNSGLHGSCTMQVVLAPSSHWHFDIREETTIMVEGIRIPKFVPYLQALASLLAYRSKSSSPAGYYQLQLLSVWNRRSEYLIELKDLPPVDLFLIEKYLLLKKLPNRRKLVELWEKLRKREIGMEEAIKRVPVERNLLLQKKLEKERMAGVSELQV